MKKIFQKIVSKIISMALLSASIYAAHITLQFYLKSSNNLLSLTGFLASVIYFKAFLLQLGEQQETPYEKSQRNSKEKEEKEIARWQIITDYFKKYRNSPARFPHLAGWLFF